MNKSIKVDITFLIPTVGRETLLYKALDSIIYKNWDFTYEIIVVADGFNKQQKQTLDEYLEYKNAKIVYNNELTGVISAWNDGVKIANSDFLVGVCDDCIVLRKFEEAFKLFKKQDKTFGICGFNTKEIMPVTYKIRERFNRPPPFKYKNLYNITDYCILRTDIIKKNLLDERCSIYVHATEIYYTILDKGLKACYYKPICFHHYRDDGGKHPDTQKIKEYRKKYDEKGYYHHFYLWNHIYSDYPPQSGSLKKYWDKWCELGKPKIY